MKKLRDTEDFYGRSLAATNNHAPKYERRSNFLRAKPDPADRYSYQHGFHRKGMACDRLGFRKGAFKSGTRKSMVRVLS